MVDNINKYNALLDKGLITREEYDKKISKILNE